MSSRDAILKRIRTQLPISQPLPDLSDQWLRFDDPLAQFSKILTMVGGECRAVSDLAAVQTSLAEFPPWQQAQQRVSLVAGVGDATLELSTIHDPHLLEHVDYAVIPGQLAVAENAAVWVDDAPVLVGNRSLRVLYFLTQHLALVVPRRALVHNLHEAYAQIDIGRSHFGAFISGPSKTADIEQSLVIGAHGARSLIVFLVDQDV